MEGPLSSTPAAASHDPGHPPRGPLGRSGPEGLGAVTEADLAFFKKDFYCFQRGRGQERDTNIREESHGPAPPAAPPGDRARAPACASWSPLAGAQPPSHAGRAATDGPFPETRAGASLPRPPQRRRGLADGRGPCPAPHGRHQLPREVSRVLLSCSLLSRPLCSPPRPGAGCRPSAGATDSRPPPDSSPLTASQAEGAARRPSPHPAPCPNSHSGPHLPSG